MSLEITVSRYMPHRPVDPDKVKRWIAFLRNHKDAIAAMDFFAVPTVSLRMLYVLFIIEHGRRRVVHFNVTANPTSAWVIQQLRESFPYDTAPKHLLFDRDTIFGLAVVRFAKAMGTKPIRTAYRCRGKTRSRSAGSVVVGASFSTMSLFLASAIYSDCFVPMSSTITRIARISGWPRTHRTGDPSRRDLRPPPRSSHCPVSEDFITATSGVRPPDVTSAPMLG